MRKKPLIKAEEVVRLLFDAALDQLYSFTPLAAPLGAAQKGPNDSFYIEGILSMLGMALGIMHVNLTGEGLGVEEAVHDFRKQFEAAYAIAWKDNGKALWKRLKKKKGSFKTAEILISWPNSKILADDFMSMCEKG